MQTIADTATGKAAYAHPKNYFTLGADQVITATFNPNYNGEAKLIAYLGNRNTNDNKIADSIKVEVDSNEIEVDPSLTFSNVGFGNGDSRVYYSPVMLATVDIIKGETAVTVTGLANDLNIGALALIPLEVQEDEPAPSRKNGCFGSIAGTASLISILAVAGSALLVAKKIKED